MTLGLILSGGGARGAYEAGVLSFVLEELAPELAANRGGVFAGTSIGAFNAAFTASSLADPRRGARHLHHVWASLRLEDVLRVDLSRAHEWPRMINGGVGALGLFDGRAITSFIERTLDMRAIARAFAEGHLGALTMSATRVADGEPVVFYQRGPGVRWKGRTRSHVSVRETEIGCAHVCASSAIPLLFPPVHIGGELFADGGLRLNTPIAPAIHLGADRLLIVSIASRSGDNAVQVAPHRTPGLAFMFGKVVNAFMLDHLEHDLEHLDRINQILEAGGPAFIAQAGRLAELRGDRSTKIVQRVIIKPSTDVGVLAKRYLEEHRGRIDHLLGRTLFSLLDVGDDGAADLASYLLFDSGFTRELLELGRKDAAAADGLRELLADPR